MKRKKSLILLILINVILCIPTIVNAKIKNEGSNWIYEETGDEVTIIPICSYKHLISETKELRVNIYFDNKNSVWAVAWDTANKSYEKKGGFDYVFSTDGDNVTIDPTIIDDLQKKGVCPVGGWIKSKSPCFGTKEFCDIKDLYDKSIPNYTIGESITKSFESWMEDDSYNCTNFVQGNIDFKEKAKNLTMVTYFPGGTIQEFVVQNPSYTNGIAAMERKMEELKKECDAIIQNNETLMEEQKQEQLQKNEEALDAVKENLTELEEEMNNPNTFLKSKKYLDCKGIFGGEFGRILKQVLNIMRFLVPILILALSVVDFVKAVAAQNQDEIKKASQKFIKRLIIGIVIFLLPTILNFLLDIAGINSGTCPEYIS